MTGSKFCNRNNLLIILCCLLFILSLTINFLIPHFIQDEIKKSLFIVNNSASRTYPNWHRIPFPIRNSLYLFNVTNVNDVLDKKSKPIVQQLGPYVYMESREKTNISWASHNTDDPLETVLYEQKKTWHFSPKLSKGSLNDTVYHLNIPLISAAKTLRDRGSSSVEYYFFNKIISAYNMHVYPAHNASQLLFDGYKDPLIDMARKFHFKVPYDKFGWFYDKNNTATDGFFQVYTGKDNLMNIGEMVSWNGKTKLNQWLNDSCNSLHDTTAADIFPPFQSPIPNYVRIFVGEICRPLKLEFQGVEDLYGVKVNRYAATVNLFNYDLAENKCYCREDGVCPANGLANTSVCQNDAPVGVSLPHFLFADKSYSDKIHGLKPDPIAHVFQLDIEPTLGIPASISVRMQIDALLEQDEHITILKDLIDHSVYYPMMWFDVQAQMDEETAKQIRLLQNLPFFLNLSATIFAIFGVIVVIALVLLNRPKVNIRADCNYDALNTEIKET